MFHRKFYYGIKPLIPWTVRMGVRRSLACRKRRRVEHHWPILSGSEHPPDGWPGWPEKKQFAFVLTHDVEGLTGVKRVQDLAKLEMQLGFRSAFNFVPESDYRVRQDHREWLVKNGFEVGVHDLYHDGKLFSSRKHFQQCAQRINRFLKEWNATGFRAGFMHHNLDWLHDLDVQYDCSTFDTDPFEPQPDGVHTIFPFWVPNPRSSSNFSSKFANRHSQVRTGYVELPYTLPQDSTLFILLREQGIDVWKKKLDWIVKHRGMALIDVHPDYMAMADRPLQSWEYPARHYVELLRYVQREYEGQFWHALPKEVAAFVKDAVYSRPQHLGAKPAPTSRVRSIGAAHRKIWIDLDNTPHVPFFEPIIEELKARGYPLLVTARDAFQVCDLADRKGLPYVKVGHHYGKNQMLKGWGLFYRALQLAATVLPERPVLAVSHGARSQLILGNLLGIPTVLIEDYEHALFPWLTRPDWVLVPEVIADDVLPQSSDRIRRYPGIKEDVYSWKLRPDPDVLRMLGITNGEIVVTVRPPATEAHYHNPESERLFERFMDRVCRVSGARVVLLPRNRKQADIIRSQGPHWFEHNRTVIPPAALDGLNLIWLSDLVVSGGGTMNREAAALGVPVYSIFRGSIGAVDRQLSREGRLILVESVEDVKRKIRLEKRPRQPLGELTSRHTLQHLVDLITEIADQQNHQPKTLALEF